MPPKDGTIPKDGHVSWNGSGSVSFTVVGVPADDLKTVRHNWGVLKPADYTATPGSTIITLNESFLRTLPAGYNLITVHFRNNVVAEFHLRINEGGVPRTNDNSNMELWTAVLVISVLGITGTATAYKLKYGKAKD